MHARPPARYVLSPGTYGRQLGWVAVAIGLANMAVALVEMHGAGRWNYFFGAMAWAAFAAMMLSVKRR